MSRPKNIHRPKWWLEQLKLRRIDKRLARAMLSKLGLTKRLDRAFFECKILPLDQMRGFEVPNAPLKICGVYFLWRGPILWYIGKSVDIINRLKNHKSVGRIYTRATFCFAPPEYISQLEREYIFRYWPPDNTSVL